MEKIDWKKRAESLAKDNIKVITDNVSLKVENKQLKEQLATNGGCPKCAYPEIVSSIDSFDSSCPNCGNEWTSKT